MDRSVTSKGKPQSALPALRSVSSPIQPRDTSMPSRQGKSPCLFTIFDVSISLRLHADAEPVTDTSTMGEVKRLLRPTLLRSRSGKGRS